MHKGAPDLTTLAKRIGECRICVEKPLKTPLPHEPRPVVRLSTTARLCIAGQAPGLRVHESGIPFDDRSGDRLREWMGIDREVFYDTNLLSIVPMGFCFPGYDTKGSDLPPPRICAQTWREPVLEMLPDLRLTVLIGAYAMKYHLPGFRNVTEAVAGWRDHPQGVFALPHPSWRNTGWLNKNPWFAEEVLPRLRAAVSEVMNDRNET